MAVKVPTTIYQESLGSLKLIIANFDGTVSSNDIDDGDTWASGINGIVGYWCNLTYNGTQTKEGCDVTLSTSTFTFNVGEDNKTGILYVLCKS